MKKVLVLYTFVGHGHKKIAENIAAALRKDFEVDLINLMELDGGKLASGGSKLYVQLLKYTPWVWSFFYFNRIFLKMTLPFRRSVASFKSKKMQELLERNNYDAVICAHTNASAVMSYLKKKGVFKGKLITTFSDYHLHIFWLYDNVDLFLANVPEQKEQMVALGYDPDKIIVCGITLQHKIQLNPLEVKKRFGLQPNGKVVLALSGGIGFGFDPGLIAALEKAEADVFIVCGDNKEMRTELEHKFSGKKNLHIYGYIDFMPELYAIADLVVTKPGGLTVAECLRDRLPMLIYNYLPGPEKLNYEYLTKKHLVIPQSTDLIKVVEHEIKTGEFARSLQNNPEIPEIVQYGDKIAARLTKLL